MRCHCAVGHTSASGMVLCGDQLLMVMPAPSWIKKVFEDSRGRCIAIADSTGERCHAKTSGPGLRCPQHRDTDRVVVKVPVAFVDSSTHEIVEMPTAPSQTVPGEDEEVTL